LDGLRRLGADAELGGELASDFEFTGEGPDGVVLIGVERKTVEEFAQSMRSKRLAGSQLVKAAPTYDEIYVLVEGIWRRQRDSGMLEVKNGGWHMLRGQIRYSEVDSFICALAAETAPWCSLHVWRTADEEETCAAVVDRYLWWQKPWHEHRSVLRSVYAPEPSRARKGTRPGFRHEATVLEKWLAALPGLDARVLELAEYFMSPVDLANAGPERWLAIQGQRLGPKTVEKVLAAIRGE
jgi:ERCC4-type nuclease